MGNSIQDPTVAGYMGAADRQLFYCYHAPQGPSTRPFGVVLCPPAGREYVFAHRTFRQLATRLSRAGFPVLRFDYFASGDSAGEDDEGSVEQWLDDIASAIDTFRNHTAGARVCLAGFRIGASLAALHCGHPPGPRPPRSTAGPGAHVTDKGVLFRVWAPSATLAFVDGDMGRVALAKENDGLFAGEVSGAKVGQSHRFVLATPAGELTRLDPYCRQRGADRVSCIVTDPFAFSWTDGAFVRSPKSTQIVYEMHIGSFSRDPVKGHGTFASTKARLDDLADLGVNVLELMPVFEFGGNPNGWGYNPHLHFGPKSSYGTADELRALVDAAHAKGMAVWLDAVVNHHDGWREAPLRCFDGVCPGGSAGVYYFGPGAYASTPWGPRPKAFDEPAVRAMLVDATRAFIDEFHGDGFRWDSTSNVRGIDGQGTTPGGKELLVAVG